MKQNIILIIIVFIVFQKTTKAQENFEKKKSEIGFNLLNYTNLTIPSDPVTQRFDIDFLNGIYFKQHFEKHSLRIAFDHVSGTVKINGDKSFDADTLNTVGNWSQNILSAGIEKNHIDKKNFQLYWGFDLNLYYGIYDGQSRSITGLSSYSIVKQDKGIGFTPLGGVRLTISNLIRLSFEANASNIVFSQVENKQNIIPLEQDNQNQTINFVFRYNMFFKLSYIF